MKTSVRISGENITGVVVGESVPSGYFEVDPAIIPKDINIRMNDYVYKDGVFILDQNNDKYIFRKTQEVRMYRDKLLTASDWTQAADAPVDQAAWATYRQELRDIPEQTGFPADVVWPIKP